MDNSEVPRPISEAPKDGTVILSNEGPVIWKPYHNSSDFWYHCTADGYVFSCADDGPFTASPSTWIPMPDWMD